MNIDKKEQVMWLGILGVIALFIMFMPQIESLLSGRKVTGNDQVLTDSTDKTGEINEISYPKTTSCTLAETLDGQTGAKLKKEVTFTYSTSGTVQKINLVKIYKYSDVTLYNKAKTTKAVDKLGIKETIVTDDQNMVLTITDVMTISEMQELTEYPTGYTELNKYLSTNSYVCTETK